MDDDDNYKEEEIIDEEIVNMIKSSEMDLGEELILESLDKVFS